MPASTEKKIEEEEKKYGSTTELLLFAREESRCRGSVEEERYGEPAAALTKCTIHHQSPPAPSLNESKADESGAEVRHCVDCGEQTGHGPVQADGFGEDVRQIVADYVDAS